VCETPRECWGSIFSRSALFHKKLLLLSVNLLQTCLKNFSMRVCKLEEELLQAVERLSAVSLSRVIEWLPWWFHSTRCWMARLALVSLLHISHFPPPFTTYKDLCFCSVHQVKEQGWSKVTFSGYNCLAIWVFRCIWLNWGGRAVVKWATGSAVGSFFITRFADLQLMSRLGSLVDFS